MMTVPCAYCGKPTDPEESGAGTWHWPGKGTVTGCRRCLGYLDDADNVDVGEGVTVDGVDYWVDDITREDNLVHLTLTPISEAEMAGEHVEEEARPVELTLKPNDPVEMFHRTGW